jgi:hypothetical protein
VACTVERAAGGSLIRAVRLFGLGETAESKHWLAPDLPPPGGADPGPDGGPAVVATRAAAKWIAETLAAGGQRSLALLCADSDGAVCSWLSTPGTDPKILEATLAQGTLEGEPGAGAGGASVGRLLASTGGGSGGGPAAAVLPDLSVQALVDPHSAGGKAAQSSKRRVAVLAVPDAPLRVLIDELDARGVSVRRAATLHHALAQAWDPGAARTGDDDPERVVASTTPTTAVVLVEPHGRLTWAWSASGRLLAGGSMLLRAIAPEPEPSDGETGSARRIDFDDEPELAPHTLEFTRADAGRLVLDWLGWSAQLGRSPSRVICLGPAEIRGGPGEGDGPGAMGSSITRAWPGAMVDLAVHQDPVGVTMARLSGPAAKTAFDTGAGGTDPRGALLGLSARPGRADRGMYRWAAAAMLALAGVVAVAGSRMFQSADGVQAAILEARERRDAALRRGETVIPALSQRADDALVLLEDEARKRASVNVAIKPPRPLFDEFLRVLRALEEAKGITVSQMEISPVGGVLRFAVPDADTGAGILERIRQNPGEIAWSGSISGGTGDGRTYTMTGLFERRDSAGGQNP